MSREELDRVGEEIKEALGNDEDVNSVSNSSEHRDNVE